MTGGAMDLGGVAAHEMFMSYVRAGFRRYEALQIVIALMTNAQNNAQQNPDAE
ncbi:hypothetical protein [Frankia sp. AgW1.1]|uniref:hypothetical protein n=1 Tax=Frankia sp. AgW1.1 TaxID=1836971 RepID=UPI001931359B|nr:hypothetical protein [Frankia sp. AgW1.1]MBL7487119.1 hypothetical protein [Frankia sp. AgW1.1]